MLSENLGHFFDKPLSSFAKKMNINPNILTITGFIITTVAAITVSQNLFLGGLLIIAGSLFDMLDGIIARVNNRATKFGAFLDSILDRYSDAFLFLGFAWYFFEDNSIDGILLSLGAMIGALLISYARARAEGLDTDCKVGLMERPERIILMTLGALTGWIYEAMWILFILTHVTVVQRIYHVWKAIR